MQLALRVHIVVRQKDSIVVGCLLGCARASLRAQFMADLPDAKKREVTQIGLRLKEVEAQLSQCRRARNRHTVFAFLGLSPAAVLPMLGLGIDFGFEIALLASVFVTGLESWRAVQAGADVREAEEERRRLLDVRRGADE